VGNPFYLTFWVKLTALEQIEDFRSIFARRASAVTPGEKVQLTLVAFLRAFQRAQDQHRTLSLSPQRGSKNAKYPKFELQAAITHTVT